MPHIPQQQHKLLLKTLVFRILFNAFVSFGELIYTGNYMLAYFGLSICSLWILGIKVPYIPNMYIILCKKKIIT